MGTVKADRSKWSEKSRRSYSHIPQYEDKTFACRKCAAPAVYSGEDQKKDYEEKKVHISASRILCQRCFKTKQALAKKIGECERAWAADKKKFARDRPFLAEWIALLEEAPTYGGGRRNSARINMLRRLAAS